MLPEIVAFKLIPVSRTSTGNAITNAITNGSSGATAAGRPRSQDTFLICNFAAVVGLLPKNMGAPFALSEGLDIC